MKNEKEFKTKINNILSAINHNDFIDWMIYDFKVNELDGYLRGALKTSRESLYYYKSSKKVTREITAEIKYLKKEILRVEKLINNLKVIKKLLIVPKPPKSFPL